MPNEIILVVDDEHDLLELVSYNLTKEGYQVKCATWGEEALEIARQESPDLILLDLMLPGVDGLEATRRLARCQPQTRILVLTSFAGDDKIFPAIKAGALGYLLKDSGPE